MIQLQNDPQDSGLILQVFKLCLKHIPNQAPVVQTVENAIQWTRLYPLDKEIRAHLGSRNNC